MAERNDNSITVKVIKPANNEQELTYKYKVEGEGVTDSSEKPCVRDSCTISSLMPGRPYQISAQALLQVKPDYFSDMSNVFTMYTVPEGKLPL